MICIINNIQNYWSYLDIILFTVDEHLHLAKINIYTEYWPAQKKKKIRFLINWV